MTEWRSNHCPPPAAGYVPWMGRYQMHEAFWWGKHFKNQGGNRINYNGSSEDMGRSSCGLPSDDGVGLRRWNLDWFKNSNIKVLNKYT